MIPSLLLDLVALHRLDPLCHEIVPEDTVPRLRGKESRRRLEVRLFKRNKDQKWFGDLVAEVKAEKNDKPRQVGRRAVGKQMSRERTPAPFRDVLACIFVSIPFDFMKGPATNYAMF